MTAFPLLDGVRSIRHPERCEASSSKTLALTLVAVMQRWPVCMKPARGVAADRRQALSVHVLVVTRKLFTQP